jgi:hypothetical protein
MRARAVLSAGELRLRDAERLESLLDHDPAAEKRLALTGSVHDGCHCPRV